MANQENHGLNSADGHDLKPDDGHNSTPNDGHTQNLVDQVSIAATCGSARGYEDGTTRSPDEQNDNGTKSLFSINKNDNIHKVSVAVPPPLPN